MKYLLLLISTMFVTLAMSQEEYLYPMGIKEGHDHFYDSIPQKAPLTRSFYDRVPPKASIKQYAPIPGNQKHGNCTAWASAYAARTILEAKKNKWLNKQTITHEAYSPQYLFGMIEPSKPKCDGSYISDAARSLKYDGAVPKKDFTYRGSSATCPSTPMPKSNDKIATEHKIEDFTRLWVYGYSDKQGKIDVVKKSIAEGNPVIIGMICPKSFHYITGHGLWTPKESPDEDVSGLSHGRHALCVVGYDDSKFGGAFEIQNSWGTHWGNNGYCWVKYEDFADFVYQAYELVQFPEPPPKEPLYVGSLRMENISTDQDLKVKYSNDCYEVTEPLSSGTKMRMYIKSKKDSYVYLFGTGSKDKSVNQLFPVDGISPIFNYSEYEVALPSEDHYFEMNATTGTDYMILVFSRKPLDESSIREKLENSYGSIQSRVSSVLGENIISSEDAHYNPEYVGFLMQGNPEITDQIGVTIIKFDHVD